MDRERERTDTYCIACNSSTDDVLARCKQVDDSAEDYLGIAEDLMSRFSETFAPGKYFVETFPSLQYVFPPGVGFKRDAEELRLADSQVEQGQQAYT